MSTQMVNEQDLRALKKNRSTSAWGRLPIFVRRLIIMVIILLVWQAYVSLPGFNPLSFATPWQVVEALGEGFVSGSLLGTILTTLRVLGISMLAGMALALLLVVLANISKVGEDFLILVSSILNPLPAIAILPLAIIWFGLSEGALIFVVANAVTWPIALNVHMGFRTVNPTILAVSKNIGVRGGREILDVLVPSALPHILTGLRTALAFGWRTIVAAELVFGVAGGSGGIGYFISQARYFLEIPDVFAALVTIAVVGLLIEAGFARLERRTVVRWGMKGETL